MDNTENQSTLDRIKQQIEENPIFLSFGWMVSLGMKIFEFVTLILISRHPGHPWVCIFSGLKQKCF